MERRALLATIAWGASSGGAWSDPTNWTGGVAPGSGDDAVIDLATAGTVTIDSAVSVKSLTADAETTLKLAAGADFSIAADSTVGGGLNLAGGTFHGGTHVLTASGASAWSDGTIDGGTLTIPAGAALAISGGNAYGRIAKNGAEVVVAGTATWSDGSIFLNGSQLSVPTGGVFDAKTDGGIGYGGNTPGTVFVAGTFRKSAGNSDTSIGVKLVIDGGTMEVRTGTLLPSSSGGSATDATYVVSTGATYGLANGGTFTYSGLQTGTGGGLVAFAGGGSLKVDTVNGATFDMAPGMFQWRGGTITGGTLTNVGDMTLGTNNQMTLDANLVVAGTATWTYGYFGITSAGRLNVAAGGVFTDAHTSPAPPTAVSWGVGSVSVAGTFRKTTGTTTIIPGPFSNTGTVVVTGGILSLTGGFANYSAATHTLTGGNFALYFNGRLLFKDADVKTNAAAITLSGPSAIGDSNNPSLDGLRNLAVNTAEGSLSLLDGRPLATSGSFANAGTVFLDVASKLSAAGDYVQSAGTTVLQGRANSQSTILAATGTVDVQGGVFQAYGIVQGNLTNAASVVIGGADAAGVLTVQGNYVQTADGKLTANIGGKTSPGTQYGQLDVTGTATLAGELDAPLIAGFLPAEGDSVLVVKNAAVSGQFDAVVTPNLPLGTSLDAVYQANGVSLKATMLVSIDVTPVDPSLAKGLSTQFVATGHYGDGSTKDLTASATWTTSDPAVASVDAAGLAKGLGEGTATIAAALGTFSGSADLTVTEAELVSIAVTSDPASVAKGRSSQFTATGTYTDESTKDLTASATWTTSDPAVASVDAAGLAKGLGEGTATIAAAIGTHSGSADLTVTEAELVSIAVTPGSATIHAGESASYTATGTYTDDTTKDLSGSAGWASSNAAVASVTNGAALGLAAGTSTITATVGGVSASADLRVETAVPAAVAGTAVSWGSVGMATLQTAADGLRLLPAGRDNTIGWFGIDRISITLDKDAALSAADVSVTGALGSYGPVTIVGTGSSYLIKLARPINDADRVTITIGNAGIATFVRRLDVLPGDVNDDGVVSLADGMFIRNSIVGLPVASPPLPQWLDVLGQGGPTLDGFKAIQKRIGTRLPS